MLAHVLAHYILSAHTVWQFLWAAAGGSGLRQAFKKTGVAASESTPFRIFRRFCRHQPHIRSCLLALSAAPLSSGSAAFQTLLHLKTAFPESSSPISAFQLQFQKLFLPISPSSPLS